MFVYGDGNKNKHAETCCCRWRFVPCSLATLLPASASTSSFCFSSATPWRNQRKAERAGKSTHCLAVGCGAGSSRCLWSHRSASPSTASLCQLVCIGINWCCCCCSFCGSLGFGLDCVQPVPSRAAVHVRLSWWCLRLRHFVCHSHSTVADSRVPASLLPLPASLPSACCRLQLGNASTLTSAGHMHIRHSGRGRRSPLSAYQHQHCQPRPSESQTSASFCTVVRDAQSKH